MTVAVNRTDDRTVAGRYRRVERLGHGGFGVVWRAHDTLLQRDVAMKEIDVPAVLEEAERAALRKKVLREAQAAARLSHPGLVTVFDVVEDDGQPFIVMELVAAPTLADLVQRDGPLPEHRAAAVGAAVLDALAEAHAHGIIHRDVKPANVMVHDSGRIQLGDFGIATILDDPKITSSGRLAGSPSYMSPEQAQNLPPSAATDVWGLGATLYYAVEGEPPFHRAGAIATLTSVVSDDPRPPTRAQALAPLLGEMLAKEPSDRPTVAAARRRLGELTSGKAEETAATVPAARPEPTAELSVSLPTDEASAARSEPALPPTPPPPAAPRPAPRRAPTPRRARPGVPAMVLPVLLIVGLVAALMAVRSRDTAGPAPPTTGPGQQAGAASGTDSSPGAVPDGWVRYRDPSTGFTIGHPRGWTVRTSGTLTDFRDPDSSTYLRVDHKQPPGPSPEGAWYTFEPQFAAANPNYRRIQITPTTFKGYDAALWEFTYTGGGADLHAVDLGFITGDYGFALNFQTRAADWERMQPTFEKFKASFKAPS